jgi:two-component system, cell cycle sensor histidine kinase and response regulator CckA
MGAIQLLGPLTGKGRLDTFIKSVIKIAHRNKVRGQIMTILVVDDEPQLRMMLAHFLEQEGFAVITAGCGTQAISLFGSHPEIDLLITDILMPGMDGPTLAAALRGLNPDLAVVLMSGNCDAKQIDNDFTFVSKPFSFIDLLGKIKSLTRSRCVAA